MQNNKVEEDISKVIQTEGWTTNNDDKSNTDSIHKTVGLPNSRTVELLIDRKNERTLIKNTVIISKDFGNKILGSLKSDFKYEFKIFLMAMDIDVQTYPEAKDSDTINVIYCLYFDEFSKNRFYHTMRKIGEIPYLFDVMEKNL